MMLRNNNRQNDKSSLIVKVLSPSRQKIGHQLGHLEESLDQVGARLLLFFVIMMIIIIVMLMIIIMMAIIIIVLMMILIKACS